jgi:ATP-dependent Clp protease ATP-binding subunit ClpA
MDALTAPPIAGRQLERDEVLEVLMRWRLNNVLIDAPPGAGKSALVSEIARTLASSDAPIALRGRILVDIDLRSLISGAAVRGQLETRFEAVLQELREYNGQVIPVFDDLPNACVGSAVASDLLWLLTPLLESTTIPVIATGWTAHQGGANFDARMLRFFQRITLRDVGASELRDMVAAQLPALEEHHGVHVDSDTAAFGAYIARRYLQHQALPESALSLLDQAAAAARMDPEAHGTLDPTHIATVASRWVGIPRQQLLDTETLRLGQLEAALERRVVGQPAADGPDVVGQLGRRVPGLLDADQLGVLHGCPQTLQVLVEVGGERYHHQLAVGADAAEDPWEAGCVVAHVLDGVQVLVSAPRARTCRISSHTPSVPRPHTVATDPA